MSRPDISHWVQAGPIAVNFRSLQLQEETISQYLTAKPSAQNAVWYEGLVLTSLKECVFSEVSQATGVCGVLNLHSLVLLLLLVCSCNQARRSIGVPLHLWGHLLKWKTHSLLT